MKGFHDFWNEQADWSRATFGADNERGPLGPLKHLLKEANEAIVACQETTGPELSEEIADCLFLVFDAARRSGMTQQGLLSVAFAKLEKNKQRQWNKPTSDEPVEHVRSV